MGLKNLISNLRKKVFGKGDISMKKKKKKAAKKPVKKVIKNKHKKVVKKSGKKAVKKAGKKAVKKATKKAAKKSAKKAVKKAAKKIVKKGTKPVKPTKKIVISAEKAVIAPVIKPEVKLAKRTELKLKKGPHKAFIGLGSNVGDREEYIEQAIFLLSKTSGIKMIRKSANYETESEGHGDQPAYLNAAMEIQTSLDPYKLLSTLHDTESALGREREVDWGPRTIDVDLLMYDDLIISDETIQVPHPLMHERIFVLKPLSEIAPNLEHPALERTILDLYLERKADVGDKYDDDLPGFKDIKKGTPDDFERW